MRICLYVLTACSTEITTYTSCLSEWKSQKWKHLKVSQTCNHRGTDAVWVCMRNSMPVQLVIQSPRLCMQPIVWTRDGMIWVQPTGIRPFLSLQATWKKSALYVSQDCCKGISDPRIWGDTINHLYHLKCVRRSEIQLNPSKRRVSAVQLRRRLLLTWHETCLPQTRDIPELLSGLGQLCPSSTAPQPKCSRLPGIFFLRYILINEYISEYHKHALLFLFLLVLFKE